MKPEEVRKLLTGAVGPCTLVVSGGPGVIVEKGKWSIVGKTVIAKVGNKDVLVSMEKISKIEKSDKPAAAAPPAAQPRSRVL